MIVNNREYPLYRYLQRKTAALMLIAGLSIFLFSCNTGESSFMKTTVDGYYLIKNPPQNKTTLKNAIAHFINIRGAEGKHITTAYFYKYTSNTAYFVKHKPDPGGHFSKDFDFYEQDQIATFGMEQCPVDKHMKLGLLRFFNNWGNYYQPDTLFNNCDSTSFKQGVKDVNKKKQK